MCGTCLNDCCCDPGYCLSVTAEGKALTITKDVVTATASASACSSVSYEDAWLTATALAKLNAEIAAKNDANIIDQTLLIVDSNSLIPLLAGLTLGNSSSQYSGVFSNTGNFSDGVFSNTGSFTDSINIGNSGTQLTSSPDGSSSSLLINGFIIIVNQINISKSNSNGIGIGPGSLNSLTTGSNNLAIGLNGLNKVTSGSLNAGFGPGVLQNNQTGNGNFAAGAYVLSNLVSGEANTGLGIFSGLNIKGSFNTTLGVGAQVSDPQGDHQIKIGTLLDITSIDNLRLPEFNNTVVKVISDVTSIQVSGLSGAVMIVALPQTAPSFANASLEIGPVFTTKYFEISSIQINNMPVNGRVVIAVTNGTDRIIPINLTSVTSSAIYSFNLSNPTIPIGKSIITLQLYKAETNSSPFYTISIQSLFIKTQNVIAGYKNDSSVTIEFTTIKNYFNQMAASFASQINSLIQGNIVPLSSTFDKWSQ